MNTTALVWYIALLMILGASLGWKNNEHFGASGLRADALNYASISEHMGNGVLDANGNYSNSSTKALMSRAVQSPTELSQNSQYVRVYIQGIPYEGTIYPVRTGFEAR
jgi:hypothetical protein